MVLSASWCITQQSYAGHDSLQPSLQLLTAFDVDQHTVDHQTCLVGDWSALHCAVRLCLYLYLCCMHHVHPSLWCRRSAINTDRDVIGLMYFQTCSPQCPFSTCCPYKLGLLFTAQIQDGPLAGVKGVQTTIGEYTIDDSEPVRQKVCCLSCPLAIVRLNLCLQNSTFRCRVLGNVFICPTHSLESLFCREGSCLHWAHGAVPMTCGNSLMHIVLMTKQGQMAFSCSLRGHDPRAAAKVVRAHWDKVLCDNATYDFDKTACQSSSGTIN